MELMIMCIIVIALCVAWFVAYYSGLSAGTLALAWLIGALLTFALQWVARRYRWESYYSDTLGGAIATSTTWFVVVPFLLALNAWCLAADPLGALWTRATAWWDRADRG